MLRMDDNLVILGPIRFSEEKIQRVAYGLAGLNLPPMVNYVNPFNATTISALSTVFSHVKDYRPSQFNLLGIIMFN